MENEKTTMQCDQSPNYSNKTLQTVLEMPAKIWIVETASTGWVYEHHTDTVLLSMLANVREKWPTSEKMASYLIK